MMTVPTALTVADWLRQTVNALVPISDEARLEAQLLLCHVLGVDRAYLFAHDDRQLKTHEIADLTPLVERRASGQPLAYLLGEREFWSLPLMVNASTLIPRADTEALVAHVLALPLPALARVVDLGTGSGAIALALASERPLWQVWATDRSASALATARANGFRLGLSNVNYCHGHWFAALADEPPSFHLIVSNPPYIAAADPHLEQGDLRFEPRTALVADDDGLADLRALIDGAARHLVSGGHLVLEHGATQGPSVAGLMQSAGYQVTPITDLAGHWRATSGLCTRI